MLKYNFKMSKDTDLVQEIKCDSIYMSPDLTFISGITSNEYGLVDNQPIFIREGESNDYKEYKIQTFPQTERGYIIFPNQKYKINQYEYNGSIVYGIIFADNNKYIASDDGIIDITSINTINENPDEAFEVNILDGNQVKDYVEISTKYYIYNSVVTIGGIDYEVDYDDETPQIILRNGLTLDVQDYNKTSDNLILPNSKKIIKFIIRKNLDYKVNVEHISYTKPFYYIKSGTTFEIDSNNKRNNIVTNRLYLINIYENGIEKWYLVDKINNNKIELTKENYNREISINSLNINGITYEIFEEWKNTNNGTTIHLYLDDKDYSFKESDIIKAINRSVGDKEIYVETDTVTNRKFVNINGVRYFAENKKLQYVTYNNKDYEIYAKTYTTLDVNNNEVETTQSYILYDGTPLLISINGLEATRVIESEEMKLVFDENTKYPIKEYEYIIINGKNYIIDEQISIHYDDSNTYEVIHYIDNQPIRLVVINVVSSNQLRCILVDNETEDTNTLSALVNSHEDYTFELENKLFDASSINNQPTINRPYTDIQYRIYKSISNINIPLQLNNFNGTNTHQEFVCNTDFFDVEIEKSINRIIDMEKDIYYPGYFDADLNKFFNVDKIIIDLHFRTRDLETWKINNDIFNNSAVSDIVGCNWNLLDYYNFESDTDSLKPYFDIRQYPYYQPSDLVYFLNFTDDDVFYQKSKIGKSFLRLSFYDTQDPRTQNLLYTSTIFMNEGNLYQNYINNKTNNGLFLSVDNIDNKVNRIISKNIGTNYEKVEALPESNLDYSQVTLTFPQEDSLTLYPVIMDDNTRLSSSFVIQNMFECSESSEGFYLYLFREYSTGIHERDIYLKVEFNHAGVGRTVTFMQPFKIDEDSGEKDMLNMAKPEDRTLLKKGCKMQEMYDYIYIKIHVKYDFINKRYYYYFPEWLTKYNDNKSEMRLNLYELKIADESLIMNTQ